MPKDRLAQNIDEAADHLIDDLARHGQTLEQWNRLWTPGTPETVADRTAHDEK